MKSSGIKEAFDSLLEVKPPVDFRTFVESPEYMGISGVYEWWFEHLTEDNFDAISRICFRGSTGAGKTTVMNLLVSYKFYLLFRKGPDPAATLGLLEGSNVYFLYFSVNLTQAKRSGFAQLRDFIDGSKWFRTHCPRDRQIDSSIRFPNRFSVEAASGVQHQISLNVWGFVLDEANFRGEGSEKSVDAQVTIEEVYYLASSLEVRLAQRFLRNGVENFLAAYISSASYATSFIQDKGDSWLKLKNAIVLDPVLYKVDAGRYSPHRFKVFFGFGEVPPCVVKDDAHRESIQRTLEQLLLQDDFITTLFDDVPLELKYLFEGTKDSNIYIALRDVCGRPSAVRGTFVTNYDVIRESYDSAAPSPFGQDSVTVSNKVALDIQELISVDVNALEYRNNPHSLFLDLSTSGDSGSLTAVRFDGIVGGVKHHSHVFTLEIVPPQYPAATDITRVERFLCWLAQYINIKAFGADNFQSVQLRQNVSKALGLPDIRISLDSTDVPHLLWLSACASHRFHMKKYDRQDREITEAIHDLKRRRVVKRKGSSDDQFQTLVGAFYLSDTVGSSGGVLPERMNVVGANSANKVLNSLGYHTGFQQDSKLVLERARQEDAQRRSAANRFERAFDDIFNQ